MNKAEIELELRALENLLAIGGPYPRWDEEKTDTLVEAVAAYLRKRISTDRSWKKYSYRVEIDEGNPKIRIMQSSDNKGAVYIKEN
jgi:hypothetical protein